MNIRDETDGVTDAPRLGVIMPCRNEEKIIRRSVASVLSFDYPQGQLTLTVVDGMSTDRTREILQNMASEDARIRILDNPRMLPAPALNIAIRSLDCDIVLRVDAHSIYPADYAQRCVLALQETGAQNVGGIIITRPGAETPAAKAIAFSLSHPFGVGNSSFRIGAQNRQWTDTVPFGCWHLETLRQLNGFSTDIPYGEDDELNGRLIATGGRILLDPAIRSEYFARAHLSTFALMLFRYGRSKPATASKLGQITSYRQLVPLIFVLTVMVSLLSAVFWPPSLLICLAAIAAHLFVGAGIAVNSWLTSKVDFRSALRMPYTFLAGHAAYGIGYGLGLLSLLKTTKSAKHVST